MKYRLIPINSSPKNNIREINYGTPKQKNNLIPIIKFPLVKKSNSKYLSTSNITYRSNKQNLSTECSIINPLNNITSLKSPLKKEKRLPLCHSPKYVFSPYKIDYNIINLANDILKQRNTQKIFMHSLLRNSRKNVIKTIKEISLKNYHIDLIKKKIIDINNNENLINQSLNISSNKLAEDFKNFLNNVNMHKTEQKKENEKFWKIGYAYDIKLKELNEESEINKKLNIHIIQIIKQISNCKKYSTFLYKIFGLQYPYENIEELDNKLKINEDIREKIINVYSKIDKIDLDIFGNEETLMRKFGLYEQKLLKILSNKEKIIKEYNNMVIDNENEIFLLKQKIKMFKEDLNEAIIKKNKLTELISKVYYLNTNEKNDTNKNKINDMRYLDENLNECIKCIKELGNFLEVGEKSVEVNNSNELKELKKYMDYSNDIVKCLEEKEKCVNEYTKIIDNIMTKGNYKDKQILQNLLGKLKRENKFKKIVNIKNKREELNSDKRIKEIKRLQKFVLFQKRIFLDAPMKIKHNKTEKIKLKENRDYDILYYSSEESDFNENKKNSFQL